MPSGDASLRASRARIRGRAQGRRALAARQQRRGEDVEGERGRDRITRRAEHGRGVDRPEHDRVSGPDSHAVHGERAELGHDAV